MAEESSTTGREDVPIKVRLRLAIAFSAALTVTLEIGIGITVGGDGQILLMISQAVAIASAFMVGNTYRLREYRRRVGREVRCHGSDKERLAQLPSKDTVSRRTQVALAGALAGEGTAVYASITLEAPSNEAHVAVMIGGAITLICGFIGTYSTPID